MNLRVGDWVTGPLVEPETGKLHRGRVVAARLDGETLRLLVQWDGGGSLEAPADVFRKIGTLRGFAAMDREKARAIASKGGKAAHAQGTAHRFTSEEAREAGRKGGIAPHRRRGRGRVQAIEGQS